MRQRLAVAVICSTAVVLFSLPVIAAALPQSTLHPAGRGAELIAGLFWWMAGGALLIWALVIGIAWYAQRTDRQPWSTTALRRFIIIGGAVFPTLVLTTLLVWGLWLLAPLRAEPGTDALRITVIGEQFWWRVRYPDGTDNQIELANELWLPVNEPVELLLQSRDVIHSFWVPALAGKMDMIPGRTTRLLLEPNRTGSFRGACAEYCGASHTFMALQVRVVERLQYEAWLAAQRAPAMMPTDALALAGANAFLRNGCGACHTIRGTAAGGRVGPDLTHVGSRLSLAAGTLTTDSDTLARWISHAPTIKPDARMPAFEVLPAAEITAMAAYLEALQ